MQLNLLHLQHIPDLGHLDISCIFYEHEYTFIPAWISNFIHYKVWDEIAYLFPRFNDAYPCWNLI